jgi:hypothetical protein
MLGCDTVISEKYKKYLVNGLKNPCDIYDRNTASSINVQLSERISVKTLDLYTADIKSKNHIDVLKQYLLICDYISDAGTIVLRIPSEWSAFYTNMVSVLTFFISMYSNVKIFKTPWHLVPKYYLILRSPKKQLDAAMHSALTVYIASDTECPLISDTFYNIDLVESCLIADVIMTAYKSMITFDIKYDQTEAASIWTDLVT